MVSEFDFPVVFVYSTVLRRQRMSNMNLEKKYKPTTYQELMVPSNFKKTIEKLFTKGETPAGGLVLHDSVGGGGSGKTTLVNMFKDLSKWPLYTIETTGEKKSSIDSIKRAIEYHTPDKNGWCFADHVRGECTTDRCTKPKASFNR